MSNNLKKHWFRHLLVLVVIVVLINLGLWQLRRLEQRRELNRQIWEGLNQPALVLTGGPVDPDKFHFRRVSVTGRFYNEESIILRGKSFNGQPGAELVAPFQITGSEQAVLVNRGWIPLGQSDQAARRQFDAEGELTIEGIAYRSQTRPDFFLAPTDPTPPPGQNRLDAWFRVDIDRIQQQVNIPLLPIFIEQLPNPAATSPPFRPDNLDLSDGPHLGYALQWFSFAVILVVLYAVFVWKEIKS